MGRVRTTFIKATGVKIYQKHKDRFTEDFAKNKDVVKEVTEMNSKKLRNVISGYITNLFRKESLKK